MTLANDHTATFAPDEVALPKPHRRWGVALRALRRLMADKDDTGQVFEIMGALNGGSTRRSYNRLLQTPRGGRIAYERVELAPRLMDAAWLDSFAPGTVGATYREFVQSENLSAQGLVDVSQAVHGQVRVDHPYNWFGRRTRDAHDIWHVLSGYHRDALGEACLVAFSFAQTGSLGWALIAIGAALRPRPGAKHRYAQAIWQGYRRGKAAKWLPSQDYLCLFADRLEDARRRLNITPPTIYDSIPQAARDLPIPKAEQEPGFALAA